MYYKVNGVWADKKTFKSYLEMIPHSRYDYSFTNFLGTNLTIVWVREHGKPADSKFDIKIGLIQHCIDGCKWVWKKVMSLILE